MALRERSTDNGSTINVGYTDSEMTRWVTLSLPENGTLEPVLPIDMQFNPGHMLSVIVYSILFIFSATGNLTVLILILRRRRSKLIPLDYMILHLAIADLLVTFLMMPLEIVWSATVYWRAGDLMCRIMAFFRIFGLFLSSFVMVCLAVDRFMAIRYPMQSFDGMKRSRIMIAFSWALSILCSLPQVVVFKVEQHPVFAWYTQCGVFFSLPTRTHALVYFLFGMFFSYLGPFLAIVVLYCGIVFELIRRHSESKRQMSGSDGLRRSGVGNFRKAKHQALKMTIAIGVIFFVCWTPYYVMSWWYFIDENSFKELDPRINKALFFFACTNSTANPIVSYTFHLRSKHAGLNRNASGTLIKNSRYSCRLMREQRTLPCPTRNEGCLKDNVGGGNFLPVMSKDEKFSRSPDNRKPKHAIQNLGMEIPASTSKFMESYV